jgi:hypothetical protein
MNIGKWIIAAFIFFAAFIGTLVTICMRQDMSLVSKDYYKEELRYQTEIDRRANAASLDEKPVISGNKRSVKIHYRHLQQMENGNLRLFCPSNSHKDKHFDIRVSGDAVEFSTGELEPGMYRAKLSWSMNGKDYYQDQVIII